RPVGTLAGGCVGWIVVVAERGAALPVPGVAWGTGVLAIGALAVLCVAGAVVAPRLLRSRRVGLLTGLATVAVLLGVPGRFDALPGPFGGAWPPDDWLLAACDVGQGDALVLSAGPGAAVVVDAGPDPAAVDRCLDRLDVEQVPLLVLTHFHADHVDGLTGVLRGRRVGAVEASPMLDPTTGHDRVEATLASAGLAVTPTAYGEARSIGDLTLQVLWPDLPGPVAGPGDGSAANDASVVLLVETHGLRILLTGDVEPHAQARLAAALPGLDVDVLKVPHHGSSHQDEEWLTSLDAEVAFVSVGADNDYGHPDRGLLDLLAAGGTTVARTDRDGALAVTAGEAGPAVVTAD
uniref:ComEC/Rec2 family competence protein n=1 Tax=Nocardioides stalactiti TaxID=2755356 RepID=UPI001601446A